jgi:chitinase
MMLSHRMIWIALLSLLFLLLAAIFVVERTQAHGSMEKPISRVYQCFLEGPEAPQSAACQAAVQIGGTQQFYDWNGVNLLANNQHRTLIPDGKLCSAGKESHRGLDLARSDWRTQRLAPDAQGEYEFVFLATAPHSTQYFDFYVTKDGYDPTQPLKWSDLEEDPFCHITSVTLQDGRYRMRCPLPGGKQGRHLIYNIWQRDDSPEAFYTCMDVTFNDDAPSPTPTASGPTPTATATAPPNTPSPTPANGGACQVEYRVRNQWSNGFEAAMRILNQTSAPIHHWSLTWNFPGNQSITSLWNGSSSQSGAQVTVTHASWNAEIAANGGAVDFGFVASYTATNPAPTAFVLNGVACHAAGATPTVTPAPSTTPTPTVTPPLPTVTTTPTATASAHTVVAYFTQWGIYERNYHVKNMITSGAAAKVTVINYAFGNIVDGQCVMTTQSGVMDAYADYQRIYTASESVDGQADQANQPLRGNFNQLKKLKQRYPNLRVLISLGGWTWSGGFHAAAKTAASRQRVVQSCIDLYLRGNLPVVNSAGGQGVGAGVFDGIDIDWEHPGTPGIGNPYGPEDSHNFTLLLQEFRRQLDAIHPGLLLTAATAAGVDTYSLLELEQIHPLLDHINLMAYDMHGAWENITGFHTPLHPSPAAPYSYPANTYAVSSAVQGYLDAGVPANKIVVGIPLYGRGWTGVANTNHGLWQAASGPAPATWEAGIEDYKVLQTLTYPVYRDAEAGTVWKYNGATFWSYDDPTTIAYKVAYVRQRQLGGLMVWSLDGDTADSELLTALHAALAEPSSPPVATPGALYLPLVAGGGVVDQ